MDELNLKEKKMAGENKKKEAADTAKAASIQVPQTAGEILAVIRATFEENLAKLKKNLEAEGFVLTQEDIIFLKRDYPKIISVALNSSPGKDAPEKLASEASALKEYLARACTSLQGIFKLIQPDSFEPGSAEENSIPDNGSFVKKIEELQKIGNPQARAPEKKAARRNSITAATPPITAWVGTAGAARARAQPAVPNSAGFLSDPKPTPGSRSGKSQPTTPATDSKASRKEQSLDRVPSSPAIVPPLHARSVSLLGRSSLPGTPSPKAAAGITDSLRKHTPRKSPSLPSTPTSKKAGSAAVRGSVSEPPLRGLPTTPERAVAVKATGNSQGSVSAGQSPASAPTTPTTPRERKLPPPLPSGHGRSASVSVSLIPPARPPKPALGRLSILSLLSAADSSGDASSTVSKKAPAIETPSSLPAKKEEPASPTRHLVTSFPSASAGKTDSSIMSASTAALAALPVESKSGQHTPPKSAVPASPTRQAPKRPVSSSDNKTPPRPPAVPATGASPATRSAFMQEDQRLRAASTPAVISNDLVVSLPEEFDVTNDGPIG